MEAQRSSRLLGKATIDDADVEVQVRVQRRAEALNKGVRELRPDVPVELAAIVDKALAKSLEDRYKTGVEMSADLANVYAQIARAGLTLTPEEQLTAASELGFFEDFTEAELKQVLGVASWERFAAGETLVSENAKEEAIYVLVDGEVAVSSTSAPSAHSRAVTASVSLHAYPRAPTRQP